MLEREDIEAIAAELAELVEDRSVTAGSGGPSQWVDAATMASLLGVSRTTVYAKANELGAIRIGTGKRARLRFDPARLSDRRKGTGDREATPVAPRRRRSGNSAAGSRPELLPIRGGRTSTAGPLRS